ncbi:RNase H-like domain found in reverse transcriptase [Popillia japonica]|uniref:RNase H-like domain found in reverse transcriptase n=1 Tax=Popillia japonica TaxID=7064 RepID=A0AAW1ISD2_POPJA
MNQPLLQYPNWDKIFLVTTDASNYAIAAVLSHGDIGSDKPIAYASRTLSDTEVKYSTIEKELFAIMFDVQRSNLDRTYGVQGLHSSQIISR